MKHYHLGDILSITTGRLVSTRHIEGVYDILGYMTEDQPFTHQLRRFSDECKPWLLRQHPQLADIDASGVNKDNWRDWLAQQVERFGEYLPVECIPLDDHTAKNPIQEAIEMVGSDRVIVIEEQPNE